MPSKVPPAINTQVMIPCTIGFTPTERITSPDKLEPIRNSVKREPCFCYYKWHKYLNGMYSRNECIAQHSEQEQSDEPGNR